MEPQIPIAVVGLSCRFAGDATDPQKLWKMCAEGRSAWSKIPSDRFNLDAFYHKNGLKLDTLNVVGGHFLEQDLAHFDANFFGFTSDLAAAYDPQFRLQLESAYEAFESAGYSLNDLAGSNTSVFAGSFFRDYNDMNMRDPEVLPRALLVGIGAAMAANRLSHFYDLRGASMTIDTGCSTTLTAFHQACQNLRARESSMSVISASNVILNPDNFMVMSSSFLSEAGRSYAFDDRASGYGRGEGTATVLIKRLDDALRDGDPIRAVIRATCLNQDGKTETITTPSEEAQAKLIREIYHKAGLNPAHTTYFEAHGTGTPTGDPIETRSVASVFQKGRSEPLVIGSVKTNIGHTETASGLAAIIKVCLALENKQIPPSINFNKPNPNIKFEDWKLRVPRKLETWSGVDGIRRASVNNFGYGGANSHLIMEDYQSFTISQQKSRRHLTNGVKTNGVVTNGINGHNTAPKSRVFILSAKDEQAALNMAINLKEYLIKADYHDEDNFLKNLAYTLGQRRSIFPWMGATSVSSVSDLVKSLDAGKMKPSRSNEISKIGFVFTGQGAQWWAMGRELIEAYPIFKLSIMESEMYLKELGATWSAMEELNKVEKSSRVNELAFSTPLCAVVQIALVKLLHSWGIKPAGVTSHSSGEVAAAFASGALNMRSAMAIVFARGQMAGKTVPGTVERKGGMVATGLGAEALEKYIDRVYSGQVMVACLNSPSSTTASGDIPAVEELEQLLKADNIFARRLKIDAAYHSHHMQALSPTYLAWLERLIKSDGKMNSDVIYSSPTTGSRETSGALISGPEHWVNSFGQPVQFIEAFKNMCFASDESTTSDIDHVVEVGPHAALGGPIQEIIAQPYMKGVNITYHPSLIRKTSAIDSMHALVAELISAGFPVDLNAVNFPFGRKDARVIHDLPKYPWNHAMKHWSEPRVNKTHRFRKHAAHDLLGSLVLGTNMIAPSWRHMVRLGDLPWLRDHVVQSDIVYPGAGYICAAIEGMSQIAKDEGKRVLGYHLKDIEILLALMVPDNADGVEVVLTLNPSSDKAIYATGWKAFQVYSVSPQSKWTEHCRGLIQVDVVPIDDLEASWSPSASAISQLAEQGQTNDYRKSMNPQDVYAALRSTELYHGPIFQNLKGIKLNDKHSIASFAVADTAATMPYQQQSEHVIDPTTLDSLFQAAYGGYISLGGANMSASFVPRLIKRLYVAHDIPKKPGHIFEAYSHVTSATPKSFETDIVVTSQNEDGTKGTPQLKIESYITQSLGNVRSQQTDAYDKFATVKWSPDITFPCGDLLRTELASESENTQAELKTELRRLCIHFITDALTELTANDVANLSPHRWQFYKWMKSQTELGSHNKLASNSSEWVNDIDLKKLKLAARASSASMNGQLVCQIGPHLAALLKDETTVSDLLIDEDLTSYNNKALGREQSRQQVCRLVKHLAYKNPKARILEIGKGNELGSEAILEVLQVEVGPLAASYDLTYVLPDQVKSAQEKFKDSSDLVRCLELDIEKDPKKQGFEIGSYDVVIASQLVKVSKNVESTLMNVRKLLKPGGILVLTENTHHSLDEVLTFGLSSNWCQGEGRTSPSLSVSEWSHTLQSNGFSGVDFEVHDCESEEFYSTSVMLSTAKSTAGPNYEAETVIVVGDSPPPHEWLDSLKNSLTALTRAVTVEHLEAANGEGKVCIFVGELTQPLLVDPTTSQFNAIKNLCTTSKGLLWIARGGVINYENLDASLNLGFLRTLRMEYAGKRLASLDLDPAQDPWTSTSALVEVFKKTFDYSKDNAVLDFEYAERDGEIQIPRFFKDVERNDMVFPDPSKQAVSKLEPFSQENRPLRLTIGTPGLVNTLVFADDQDMLNELPEDSVEIEPKAFGVNLRDVMVAMGMNETKYMGYECSGIVKRVGTIAAAHGFSIGDRVAALTRSHYSSLIRTEWTQAAHIPEDLSFEAAATIPHSYTAAYICLFDIARLQKGEKILIHAAAGGFGQAAITLAKHLSAEIFVTVGTPEKKELLINEHGIDPDHIFSSRDNSFAAGILSKTGGKGVDVVVNTLAGNLLQESFNCVGQFGRFIELGKRDLELNHSLEMGTFARNVTFSSVDLLQILEHKGAEVSRVLKAVIDLFKQGIIRTPSPVTIHSLSEIEKTFRILQSGKHMGKVVISVKPGDMVPTLPRVQRATFLPDSSYLVVGGLGGLGRSVCQWFTEKGAKNLIIMSRSASGEKVASFIDEAAKVGCKVYAVGCDISIEADLAKALEKCARDMPPIRGVIQGAMVLKDSILEQMTADQYRGAIRPKVQGSWNLHKLLPAKLDFFVLLSSLSGVVGIASQCNYAAGGTFQDALARHRTLRGLHGAAIDIGAVQAVGVVAESEGIADNLRRSGFKTLAEAHVIKGIECAITSSPQTQILLGLDGMDWEASGLIRDQRFAALTLHQSAQSAGASSKVGAGELANLIASASSLDEAVEGIVESIICKLMEIFMLPEGEIDAAKAPRHYGVDSLSAVELRNMLALRAGAETSIFDIMQSDSVTALATTVALKSSHIDPGLVTA